MTIVVDTAKVPAPLVAANLRKLIPVAEVVDVPNQPPINDQNLRSAWQIDLRVSKGFDIYKSMNMNAFVEVRNLTDRHNILELLDADKYYTSGYPAGPLADPFSYSASQKNYARRSTDILMIPDQTIKED